MRELLLVRKLEEEQNAKKKTIDSPADTKSETLTQHAGHDPSTADGINVQTRELDVGPDHNDEALTRTQDEHKPTNEPEPEECVPRSSVVEDDVAEGQEPKAAEVEASFEEQEPDSEPEPEPEPVVPQISEEEKRRREEEQRALQTKRQSLIEFFKTKPSYVQDQDKHHRTPSGTIIVEGASMSFGTAAEVLDHQTQDQNAASKHMSDSSKDSTDVTVDSTAASESIAKVQSLATVEESPAEADPTEANELPAEKSTNNGEELSLDEKRQRAAAARSQQRKSLKELMMQKKREAASRAAEDEDIVVTIPKKKPAEDAAETEANVEDGQTTPVASSRSKRSPRSTDNADADSADVDSDGSIDLNKLIAQGSDLDDAALNVDIDGVDDNDEDFWKVDASQLEKHLSPLASPMRRLSPDPQGTQPVQVQSSFTLKVAEAAKEDDGNCSDTLLEVDGEEVDDLWSSPAGHDFERASTKEEDEFDMQLDTQITPILQPTSSPSPSPSPRPSLTGGKIGLPLGLPKHSFSAHFNNGSPLSPGSSRTSSNADPDEYETMSNGSYTSVRSAGSSKSAVGGRRPSTTTGLRAPSRVGSHSISPTRIGLAATRPRSMSIVSTSSTEESTTSSIGGAQSPTRMTSPTRNLRTPSGTPNAARTRSLSRMGTNPTNDNLRSSASAVRPLGRSTTVTAKSSKIQARGTPSPAASKLTRSMTVQAQSAITRPASRASTVSKGTPQARSISRPGTVESKVSTGLKKPRPQSVAVGGASPATNRTGIKSPPSLKSPGSGVRTSGSSLRYSGRQSSDSLSSHEDYSPSNMIFTPPDSPSETDSLTSMTSYGSSPGRETSPVPPAEPPVVTSPTRRLARPTQVRPASVAGITPPSVSKPAAAMASRLTAPSKLVTPSARPTGLRRPKPSS